MRFFLLLALFFVGCSAPAKKEGSVQINQVKEPTSFDPRKVRDLASLSFAKMIHEGLTRQSPSGPLLALASKIECKEEGYLYEISLKKGVWENGDPITAHDFVRSLRAVLSPHFPSDYAFLLFPIAGAKEAKEGKIPLEEVAICALADDLLQIALADLAPHFLDLLSMPVFFPVHPAGGHIASGPFRIEAFIPGERIELVKNERYWDAKEVKLEALSLFFVDPEVEYRLFEQGKLDWAGSPLSALSPDLLAHLKKWEQAPFAETSFFRINTKKVPDVEVRQALACGINRKRLAEHIMAGAIPALGFVPPSLGGIETEIPLSATANFPPSLAILYVPVGQNSALVQQIKEEWEEQFEVAVALEPVELKSYYERLKTGQYEIALGSWVADMADPINFLSLFEEQSGPCNNTAWSHPLFALELEKSRWGDGSRREHLLAAEELLLAEAPIIPLYHRSLNYVVKERLKGVFLPATGHIDFRWAFLETRDTQ